MTRMILTIAAAVFLLVAPGTAMAAEPLQLRLGHVAAKDSNYDRAATNFADKVKAATNGAIKIEVFAGGVLGAQPQLLAQLRAGALDFWIIDTSGIALAKEARDFQVMMAPYLFRDQDHLRAFIASPVFAEMMGKAGQETGVKHIGLLADLTPRALSTSNKAVRTPADLKGLRLRTPELPFLIAAWKEWGAAPTPVKATDLFQALQSGMVDGQENGIAIVMENSFNEVQKYYMTLDYVRSGLSLFMSGQSWAKLSADQQAVLVKAAAEVYGEERAAYPRYLEDLFKRAKSSGLTIVDPDIAAFQKIGDEVNAKFDGEAWTKGLFQRIREIK